MKIVLFASTLAFSVLVGACVGDEAAPPPRNSSAQPDAGAADSAGSVAAEPLVPSDADTITVTSKGGMFVAEHDPESNCWPSDSTFTLTRQTHQLTWKTCNTAAGLASGAAATLKARFAEGQKTLTDAEYAKLDEALRAMKVIQTDRCQLDLPVLTITVTSPDGPVSYLGGSDQCGKIRAYADGLLLVLHRLDALAGAESFPYLLVGFEDPAQQNP